MKAFVVPCLSYSTSWTRWMSAWPSTHAGCPHSTCWGTSSGSSRPGSTRSPATPCCSRSSNASRYAGNGRTEQHLPMCLSNARVSECHAAVATSPTEWVSQAFVGSIRISLQPINSTKEKPVLVLQVHVDNNYFCILSCGRLLLDFYGGEAAF